MLEIQNLNHLFMRLICNSKTWSRERSIYFLFWHYVHIAFINNKLNANIDQLTFCVTLKPSERAEQTLGILERATKL